MLAHVCLQAQSDTLSATDKEMRPVRGVFVCSNRHPTPGRWRPMMPRL